MSWSPSSEAMAEYREVFRPWPASQTCGPSVPVLTLPLAGSESTPIISENSLPHAPSQIRL